MYKHHEESIENMKAVEITAYEPPEDIAVVLTRYAKDYQEWWRKPLPNIKEW